MEFNRRWNVLLTFFDTIRALNKIPLKCFKIHCTVWCSDTHCTQGCGWRGGNLIMQLLEAGILPKVRQTEKKPCLMKPKTENRVYPPLELYIQCIGK